MSDEYGDDALPTFNNLDGTRSIDNRKRRPPSNSTNVNLLPVGEKDEEQEIEQSLPPCHVCHTKRTHYDRIIESIVCDKCGNIESVSIETLMNEQRQLSTRTDPYTPIRPVFISFAPNFNYSEDIHRPDKEVYKGSSQEALQQEYEKFKRRQNNKSWFDR